MVTSSFVSRPNAKRQTVTAFNEYALKAFEVSAVDYLLKPVDLDKLKAAIERVKKKHSGRKLQEKLETLKEAFKTNEFNKTAIPMADGSHFMNTSDHRISRSRWC